MALTAAVITMCAASLSAQRTKSSQRAGEQRNAEKGLKDNRYFFYFINSTVTNFGTDEEKKLYKEAIQRDLIAQQMYMKFLFHESFTEIRRAQEVLIELYQKIIMKEILAAKELLNGFAPEVVKSNDYRSRLYLRLGYRDSETARIDMVMADNFREHLFSMRLYKYVRAIKSAKHGKRYAFFSMIYIRNNNPKFEPGRLTFEELKKEVDKITGEEAKKQFYQRVHFDNYYATPEEMTFFDRVWEKPELNEIPEYQDYMKIN
jgi:hypothetical protein